MTPADDDAIGPASAAIPITPHVEPRVPHWHSKRAVRANLTYVLVGMVAFTLLFSAVQVARGYWEVTREFSEVFLAAEIGVLGSAITFYFVTEHGD